MLKIRYVHDLNPISSFIATYSDLYMILDDNYKDFHNTLKAINELGGEILEYVPERLQTYDICLIAVRNNPYSIRYVKRERLSENDYNTLVDVAIEGAPHSYFILPQDKKTPDVLLKSIRLDAHVILGLEPEVLTIDILSEALNSNPELLDYFEQDHDLIYELCIRGFSAQDKIHKNIIQNNPGLQQLLLINSQKG
jgi:hypothetical protein